jgi:4-hydroxy-tetrahydrodipicolinate synthase
MALIDVQHRGIFVMSVTPFHSDRALDWDSLDRVMDHFLHAGGGLTISGIMGEAPKVCGERHRKLDGQHGRRWHQPEFQH